VVNRDKFLIRETQDEACRVCCKTRCLKKNLIQLYKRARREISFTSVWSWRRAVKIHLRSQPFKDEHREIVLSRAYHGHSKGLKLKLILNNILRLRKIEFRTYNRDLRYRDNYYYN